MLKGSGYLVRGCEALVVVHYGFMTRFRLRVVLEPLCLFLLDEGFVVPNTT